MNPIPMREEWDCLRATIASVLELPYETVPDFTEPVLDRLGSGKTLRASDGTLRRFKPDWWDDLQAWASGYGLFVNTIDFVHLVEGEPLRGVTHEEAADLGWFDVLTGWWLAEIRTRIPGEDHSHMVVMHGPELAHDPQPDEAKRRGEPLYIGGMVFAALDPARIIRSRELVEAAA